MKFLNILIINIFWAVCMTGCGIGLSKNWTDSSNTTVNDWKQHYNINYFQGQGSNLNYIEANAGLTLGSDSDYSSQNINLTSPAGLTVNNVVMTQAQNYCNPVAISVFPFIFFDFPQCTDYGYHASMDSYPSSVTYVLTDNYNHTLTNTFALPALNNNLNLSVDCAVSTNSQIIMCDLTDFLQQFNLSGYNMSFYPLDNLYYSFQKSGNIFILVANSNNQTPTIPKIQVLFSKSFSLQNSTPAGGEFYFNYYTPNITVVPSSSKIFDTNLLKSLFKF